MLLVSVVVGLALSWQTASVPSAWQSEPDAVSRISAYVERYYSRAQTIVADETVQLQPLGRDFSFAGFPRRLHYEVSLEWNPDAAPDKMASVVRKLVSARGPILGPPDQPDCMDPPAFSPEPLAFLLPGRRDKFRFTMAGTERLDGRMAMRVDYRPVKREPPTVAWDRECGKIELPFGVRGRIWADPNTAEILRIDESLVGQFDLPPPPRRRGGLAESPTLERSDTKTVYTRVEFQDPPETLLLPASVDSLTIIRRSGMPQLRVIQTFSNYRRFVTAGRIVE